MVGAAGQVVADVHVADADGSAEGCDDAFLAERSLELIDRRPCSFSRTAESRSNSPLEMALLPHQLAAATIIEMGQAQVGLGGFEQGASTALSSRSRGWPALTFCPRLELQIDDSAVGLEAQVHAL